MKFSVFASGSKANCTYLECGTTRILIDCGLSARQTEGRLRQIGVDPASIDAIVITHEHYDHVRGLKVFVNRWRTPVFANKATAMALKGVTCERYFTTGSEFTLGGFLLAPVSITHDAQDPVAFVAEGDGVRYGHFTDLGKVTGLVQTMAKNLDAMLIESNHDLDLLWSCRYPWELKQRIASPYGHLSNVGAGELLGEVLHSGLRHVVLGHLSENSNTPECARASAAGILAAAGASQQITLALGSPYTSTPLYTVGESGYTVIDGEDPPAHCGEGISDSYADAV